MFLWVLAAEIAYVLFAPIPTRNVMAATAVGVFGWVGLVALWSRTRGILTPSVILLWIVGPFFVAMPLLQLTIERYSDYHISAIPASFIAAAIAVAVYLIAFATGTAFGRSMTAGDVPRIRAFSLGRLRQVVWAYVVLGAFGWLAYFHAMGGLQFFLENMQNRTQMASGLGYLFLLATLLQVGTLIAASFAAARLPIFSKPVLIALVVMSIGLVFLVGMRSRGIMFVAMIAISAHALGRRVKRSQWIALGVVGVIAIVVIGQVRELGSGTGAIFSSKEVKGAVQAGSVRLLQQAVVDYGHFDRLSLIQEYVPARLDFQYGRTLISTLGAPVPRAAWHDKPLGAGPLLANTFRPGAWDLDEGWASGVTPTIMGELFLNFSWLGVVCGGILMGALAGWAHAKFERNRQTVWVSLSYTVFVILFLASGTLGEFYGTVMMYAVYAVPIALASVYSRTAPAR
jgi:hypothetical protein